MPGGKLQLLIRGSQDKPLIGNPQITFFKQLYRKHTNFSMDSIRLTVSGQPKFNNTYKVKCEHYGELFSNIYCKINLPELNRYQLKESETETETEPKYLNWVNGIGYTLFENLIFNIGDQVLDRQTGQWLFIQDQLNNDINNNNSNMYYNYIVNKNQYKVNNETLISEGNIETLNNIVMLPNKLLKSELDAKCCDSPKPNKNNQLSFITNFKFWFCKYLGCAIPMIAIPNLDITLTIKNRNLIDLINSNYDNLTSNNIISKDYYNNITKCCENYSYYDNFQFFGEYIFLDNDEKRRFSQNNHKYLIEQIQHQCNNFILTKGNFINETNCCNEKFNNKFYKYNYIKIRLDFTNPVKYFVWVPNMYSGKSNLNKIQYLSKSDQNKINTNSISNLLNKKVNNDCCYSVINTDCLCPEDNKYNNNLLNFSIYKKPKEILNIPTDTEHYLFDTAQIFMENIERTPIIPNKFFANIFQKRYFNTVSNTNYIYCYSFSLNPNDHQPSGSCNFSKLSNIFLNLNDLNFYDKYDYSQTNMSIYACSYNILTIQSGNCYIEY